MRDGGLRDPVAETSPLAADSGRAAAEPSRVVRDSSRARENGLRRVSKVARFSAVIVAALATAPVALFATPTSQLQSPGASEDSAERVFDLLHTASKDNYEAWTGNVWGTVGFLVVVLGWLLTARGARVFLSRNHGARRVAIIVLAVIALINMGLNIDLARRSSEIQKTLKESDISEKRLTCTVTAPFPGAR